MAVAATSTSPPALWVIAGPNGVGKTTYAYRHIRSVSGSVHFVNLDEIARGLSPLDPDVARDAAARIALRRIQDFIQARQSFSLETTLAGRTHLRTLASASAAGFDVRLLYFMVPTVDVCLSRVARRVVEGGHNVPEADVRRRYARSIDNFVDYARAVDRWTILENSRSTPHTAAEGKRRCLAVERDVSTIPQRLTEAIRSLPACSE